MKQDMILPLPANMGHFDFIIHAAGIASPMYYRATSAEVHRRQHQRPAEPARLRVAERDGGPAGRRLSCSTRRARSTAIRRPSAIPTPETYRGYVSCTGPRACYDESKRFGETLCVTYAQQEGLPVKIARPFNNYGPGLKITDGRVIPDFARNVLAGRRHRDALRRHAQAHLLLCDGCDRRLLQGARARRQWRGLQHRHREAGDLDGRAGRRSSSRAAKTVRLSRARSCSARQPEADYLVDNPNRRCPVIRKAREQLGYDPQVIVRRRRAALLDLVPPQPRRRNRLMKSLDHRYRLRRTGLGGLPRGLEVTT